MLGALTLIGVSLHIYAEHGLCLAASPSYLGAARDAVEAPSRADEELIRDMLLHD